VNVGASWIRKSLCSKYCNTATICTAWERCLIHRQSTAVTEAHLRHECGSAWSVFRWADLVVYTYIYMSNLPFSAGIDCSAGTRRSKYSVALPYIQCRASNFQFTVVTHESPFRRPMLELWSFCYLIISLSHGSITFTKSKAD
jgi:hypothetical protein